MFKSFPVDCLNNAEIKLDGLIYLNNDELDKLLKITPKTYNNFMKPFMELQFVINEFYVPVSHMNLVNDSELSRQVYPMVLMKITKYFTELMQREDIYLALKEISKTELNIIEKKVIDDNILRFELSGVHLEADQKNRIKDMNLKLAELSDQYSKNLLDATNEFELKLKDDTYIKSMPESDKSLALQPDKSYIFTLQAPSYISFMTYCDNRDLRKEIYKAYMTRAVNNSKLIEEILSLRKEMAEILGYKNYADMNNVSMSAKSVDDVILFLEELAVKGKPFALKELADTQEFGKKLGIDNVESFDLGFINNLIKKEKLGFVEEDFLPYFESRNVTDGLLKFLSKLFDIQFVKVENVEVWDDEVVVYDLLIDNNPHARLFLDLYNRKSKRGGAWMNDWHTYRLDGDGNEYFSSAFIVANFPPPKDGKPSLLKHSDVTTLFHEAGHVIHHILSKVNEGYLSGVNGVEWDAIEFPSQFIENFAYEKKVLELFAKDFNTGKAIPDEMIDKLIKNKNFGSAMQLLRQTEFALFDMLVHQSDYSYAEVKGILNKVREKVAVILPPDYTSFENSFSHIFAGGYAAGYYSYKWAEMLSADAYLQFSEAGVFDKELARRFFDNILSRGAEETMDNLFFNFAGRKPDPEALLKTTGLL